LGGDARRALAARLEARRGEIEEATLTRVKAVAGPARAVAPDYAEGLRTAVASALDSGLGAVERGDGSTPDIPAALLVQARLAARHGVGLGTVLRRYSAGYSLLSKFLAEEAEREGVAGCGLAHLLEVQATLFDRIVEAVTDEYGRERTRPASVERRRAELVKRLLDGAFVDTTNFAYDFDAHHIAAIARGIGAGAAVDDLARTLDCQRLTVAPGEGVVWAWLGHGDPLPADRLDLSIPPHSACLAVGEPGQRISGWRRSHLQASAALLIATRNPGRLTRYRDVALVTSIVQDELLADSLRELYLDPLLAGHARGDALIETLRAYLAAGRNSASAAAALDVSRQTVNYRLRAVEEHIGRPLAACIAAVEAALELHEFERAAH
jgi:hypothetical protein